MTQDDDVIILTPNEVMTPFYQNNDAWGGGSRCAAQGGILFSGPIPANFVVPGAGPGNTPNYATAVLSQDNHTLVQGQPMARCTAGGTATIMWSQSSEDLYNMGFSGGHGGSMLSSIGGTIRLGELVPGGVIRHALKVNLDGMPNYWYDSVTHGYRWPATASDSCASSCYKGPNPALMMGSLLALSGSLNLSSLGLETDAAWILARAFQDYGGYTVDNAAWSVYALSTEFSPKGKMTDEFASAWGYRFDEPSKSTPWGRDMDRIFGALNVVTNWNSALWSVVSLSNGALGAGGGLPRVAWAPALNGTSPPPPPPPPPPPTQVPGAPLNLVAVPAVGMITTLWAPPSSEGSSPITNYHVYRGTTPGGETLLASLGVVLTYVDTNVITEQPYYYKTTAVNSVGEGPASNEASATPPAQPPPPPPPPGNNTPPSVDFTWTPPAGDTTVTYTFTATASDATDPPENVSVRWDWNGDGLYDTAWSLVKVIDHLFDAPGDYPVVGQAMDTLNALNQSLHTVTVDAVGTPPPPIQPPPGDPPPDQPPDPTPPVTMSACGLNEVVPGVPIVTIIGIVLVLGLMLAIITIFMGGSGGLGGLSPSQLGGPGAGAATTVVGVVIVVIIAASLIGNLSC